MQITAIELSILAVSIRMVELDLGKKPLIASIFWPNFNNKTARLSATETTEKLQYLQSPGTQAWAMPPYIANCGSLPVCAWRYGTLLTLKCKTSPDRASLILLIKEDTLKSNFVLECELMTINGNVMQKGLFIWHRKGCDIEMSKNFVLNIDNIAASLFENKWLSWQIVRWLRQLPQEGV